MRRGLGVALCGSAVVVASFYLWTLVDERVAIMERSRPYMEGDTLVVGAALEHWESLIREIGPSKAYETMLADGFSLNPSQRHPLAHTFGEALYELHGPDSVIYCGDGEFLFGCHHQVMGMTTLEYGVDELIRLAKVCQGNPASIFGCSHAIGHSLLAAYGYTHGGLDTSLAHCRSMFGEGTTRYDACVDGAFMEYNLHEMSGAEEEQARAYEESAAYEPCTKVSLELGYACFFEQSRWWIQAWGGTPLASDDLFKRAGELCRGVGDLRLRKACFLGIGYPAAQRRSFDTAQVSAACRAASESHAEYALCASGAAMRYRDNKLPVDTTCQDLGLSDTSRDLCERVVTVRRSLSFEAAVSFSTE